MNYYLIEKINPKERLRHYKNARVPSFVVAQLNAEAGFDKYEIASDKTEVHTVRLNRN